MSLVHVVNLVHVRASETFTIIYSKHESMPHRVFLFCFCFIPTWRVQYMCFDKNGIKTPDASGDKQGCANKPPCGVSYKHINVLPQRGHQCSSHMHSGFYSVYRPVGKLSSDTWWKLSQQGVGNSFTEELQRQITSTTRSMRVCPQGVYIPFLS